MSNLTGFYELSLWEDVLQQDGTFKEQRVMVIGASDMDTQAKAVEPRWTVNVNGSHSLSFKMYYRYIDNITGQIVENPFTKHITNESKIKLKHKDKWYDLIIKTISENSKEYSFTYSATDYHVNELSKNGFGLTLSTELENNIGTVKELGGRILKDTDWGVDSESIPQTIEEALIEIDVKVSTGFSTIYHIIDSITPENLDSPIIKEEKIDTHMMSRGSKVYVFYSCLKEESDRLQFFIFDKQENIERNSDHVILNKDHQYYIDNVTYIIDENYGKFGLKKPNIFSSYFGEPKISTDYRGNRYVFSRKTLYNQVLDKYVTEFKEEGPSGDKTWHLFTETKYEAPIMIKNLVNNNKFTNTVGWTAQYLAPQSATGDGAKEPYANKLSICGAEISVDTYPSLTDHILNGSYNPNGIYQPYLLAKFKTDSGLSEAQSVLVNSGFYDNRKSIDPFCNGQQYVLLFKTETELGVTPNFIVEVGEKKYITGDNCYLKNHKDNITFLKFDASTAGYVSGTPKYSGYKYVIASVDMIDCNGTKITNLNMSEIEFLSKKIQIFITINGNSAAQLYLSDFQIFPLRESYGTGKTFMFPDDPPTEAQIITEYYYFNPDNSINKSATSRSGMYIQKFLKPKTGLKNSYMVGAEKSVTVSIKQSNYFNAIHTLCEAAECWPDFQIEHNEIGEIQSKKIIFRRYIGQDNHIGFRYGVNLNQITRQVNSNAIVTKLVTQDNENEHANNGFCTIQRAGSNEIGENYIYDFSYYFNKGMIDRETFVQTIYNYTDGEGKIIAEGPDIDPQQTEFNLFAYYPRLSKLNQKLDEINTAIVSYSVPLLEAEAKYTTANNGYLAAQEEFKDASAKFLQLTGFDFGAIKVAGNPTETARRENLVKNNETVNDCFLELLTFRQNEAKFAVDLQDANNAKSYYNRIKQDLEAERKQLLKWKEGLNLAFYKIYSRFIQEGTWKDDAAIDDEKYYINARSVAYNSSMPQVTYTINVLELQGLPEYEHFVFNLADKTWIEDTEFFGFDESGNPIREEITITEIIYNLDDPSNTSVKVQTYKSQFQDLFQRITAQVQSAQYSSGAWENAAKLVDKNSDSKSQFMEEAFKELDFALINAGNQSVVNDKNGITITDLSTPSQQLRMTGGAILLSDMNAGGEQYWRVGLTAKGINASAINAGVINTDKIQIMSGTSPTFRWDKYGLNAFAFDYNTETKESYNYDFNKGVRFDRFGIYGFSVLDGADWKPGSTEEIKENAIFALSWDGLSMKPGYGSYKKVYLYDAENKQLSNEKELDQPVSHASVAQFGRTNGYIYNSWVTNPRDTTNHGLPYYNPNNKDLPTFVKILSILGGESGEQDMLAIYDDGTLVAKNLKLTGTVEYVATASPVQEVYAHEDFIKKFETIEQSLPADNTPYNSFAKEDGNGYTTDRVWHKNKNADDSYYAYTTNAGATWTGPYLVAGKTVIETEIKYIAALAGTTFESLEQDFSEEKWQTDKSKVEAQVGQNIYTRIRSKFKDGTYSKATYSIEPGPVGTIKLNKYSAAIVVGPDGKFNTGNSAMLKQVSTVVVRVYDGDREINDDAKGLTYKWTVTGGYLADTNTGAQIDTSKFGTINSVYLSEIFDNMDYAEISVEVRMGSMELGSRSFVLSKSVQYGTQCYVVSSAGIAFNPDTEIETNLSAYLLYDGADLDPTGTEFEYVWYIDEFGSNDSPLQLNGKNCTGKIVYNYPVKDLLNKQIYFTAIKKQDTN